MSNKTKLWKRKWVCAVCGQDVVTDGKTLVCACGTVSVTERLSACDWKEVK